jgi:uncharacterized protein (DUF983 family)
MSPLQAALKARCPACGVGKLYDGLLAVTERCSHCNLSLKEHEKGDGPAFFAIVVVGFVTTALAAWVEMAYAPPYWLHALLWPPVILVLSLWMLRFFKALIIAVQYRHMGLK